MNLFKPILLTAALLFSVPASAGIIFTAGNNPQANEENILFQPSQTNVTNILGHTNQSNVGVNFFVLPGGETTISTNGIGQADIVCATGCGTYGQGGANGMQLTALGIKVQNGFGFHDFIGNPRFGEGTAEIKVTDGLGTTFDFQLDNGQNFFTLVADGTDIMTTILITEFSDDGHGNWGFNDFKQPRISGLCVIGATGCTDVVINPQCTDGTCDVPEPSSLAVFGFALLVGIGWYGTHKSRRKLLT